MRLMDQSCAAMLQYFLYGHLFNDSDHAAAYRLLLWRIVMYIHEMYVNLANRKSPWHAPFSLFVLTHC